MDPTQIPCFNDGALSPCSLLKIGAWQDGGKLKNKVEKNKKQKFCFFCFFFVEIDALDFGEVGGGGACVGERCVGERCAHGKLIPVVRTVCDCCHQGDPCWSSLSLVKVERPGLLPVPVFVVRVTMGFQDPRVPVHRRNLEYNILHKDECTKKKKKSLNRI